MQPVTQAWTRVLVVSIGAMMSSSSLNLRPWDSTTVGVKQLPSHIQAYIIIINCHGKPRVNPNSQRRTPSAKTTCQTPTQWPCGRERRAPRQHSRLGAGIASGRAGSSQLPIEVQPSELASPPLARCKTTPPHCLRPLLSCKSVPKPPTFQTHPRR